MNQALRVQVREGRSEMPADFQTLTQWQALVLFEELLRASQTSP